MSPLPKPGLYLLLTAALLASGCSAVKIGRITADPSRYQNRNVRVNGTVVNSMGVLGTGGYQLEDETGKIYVLSRSGVPSKGARVTVKGTVIPGAQVLGQSIGTTIREESHRLR
jgi:hypothetical protein